MQLSNSIRCIPFANILLKIHYSFPMKYWLLLCLFLPPFHFSFTYMILAIIMSIPLTFPVLMSLLNYYEPFSIEGKTDLSERRVSPQKLIEIMQFSNSICVAIPTRRKFNKFLVRPHKFPIPTSIGCASPKLSLHTLV